jgi:hypothetical protein
VHDGHDRDYGKTHDREHHPCNDDRLDGGEVTLDFDQQVRLIFRGDQDARLALRGELEPVVPAQQ